MILPVRNNEKDEIVEIDSSDLELVKGYAWYIMRIPRDGYTTKYVIARVYEDGDWKKPKTVYLHRVITDCPKGKIVDHINGNELDNHRSNLRVCTHSENQLNRHRGRGRNVKR